MTTDKPEPAAPAVRAPGEAMVLWVIWLSYGSFYFCRQNIAAAVPGLKSEGLDPTQIGLILGALKIAYANANAPGGGSDPTLEVFLLNTARNRVIGAIVRLRSRMIFRALSRAPSRLEGSQLRQLTY